MKCPTCGCETFYVKDPEDEFEIHEFSCSEGMIEFSDDIDAQDRPDIKADTETFCNKCAWHGKFADQS